MNVPVFDRILMVILLVIVSIAIYLISSDRELMQFTDSVSIFR